MRKFYSPTTRGFYSSEIHKTVPDDAVEISEEEWRSLLDAESAGKVIQSDPNGKPFARSRIAEEKTSALITERDNLLAATDWLVNRHRDEVEIGHPTTLTNDRYRALQTWRMTLRNVSNLPGFPNVSLPGRPEGV